MVTLTEPFPAIACTWVGAPGVAAWADAATARVRQTTSATAARRAPIIGSSLQGHEIGSAAPHSGASNDKGSPALVVAGIICRLPTLFKGHPFGRKKLSSEEGGV